MALPGILFLLGLAPQDSKPTSPIPADTELKTTASGLKYSVLTPGTGRAARAGDRVKVHYTGWLTDGTQFDSSLQRGEPFELSLPGNVIKGWNEGLELMPKGSKYKFTIPYELAYGEAGRPPVIPAKATLVFVIEMLEIAGFPDFHACRTEKTVTTKSGLKYEVLTEGTGDLAKETEPVEFRYALWTKEGKGLECSEVTGQSPKGKPSELAQQIKFIGEALQLMKPGGRYRFEVPPELCFGAQAKGPDLPANSVTVWEIELVRVLRALPVPAFVKTEEAKLQKTKSGLMYEVLKEGAGESPKMGDPVTCHYAGWLTNGSLFDSSFERGEPQTFRLGMVIPGWNEGLQLMKPGGVYRFTIPAALAYGAQGSPPKIGANETLIFHVELIKIGQ